jgi:hypothetical protein
LEFWLPKLLNPAGQHCLKVDTFNINLEQVKQWIQVCDREHSKCTCAVLSKNVAPFEMIFIDVERKCLTMGDSTAKYTTLSYVWGLQKAVVRTLLSNIDALKIHLSLSKDWDKLPAAIKDAIILTEALNIRFLWVDRLCIIQDDNSSLEENISRMASIYSNACFTIVAADGNEADFGLRGIHTSSGPRTYFQNMINFHDLGFQFRPPMKPLQLLMEGGSLEGSKSLWHSRGWTFQERAVSKRCLVFCQDELGSVKWECEEGMQCETLGLPLRPNHQQDSFLARFRGVLLLHSLDQSHGNKVIKIYPFYDCYDPFRFPQHRVSPRLWPDCEQYFSLCQGFSKRKLTYQEDALKAFSAIIQFFQPSFPGGFIFATPEFAFDDGLLWNFTCSHNPVRRPMFPSWSWIGWEGVIRFDTRRQEISRKPLVSWKKKDIDTRALKLLDNSYHIWRAYTGEQVPPGWTRGVQSPVMFKYEKPSIDQLAIDESLREEFPYPVPIVKSIQPESCSFVWRTILYGTGQRANFAFAKWDDDNGAGVNDTDGNHIGYIKSHPGVGHDSFGGNNCSVIAICETIVWRNHTTRVPDFPLDVTDHPYIIEVLWVEWREEIAYRKGTGWVTRSAWNDATPDIIDIKLG